MPINPDYDEFIRKFLEWASQQKEELPTPISNTLQDCTGRVILMEEELVHLRKIKELAEKAILEIDTDDEPFLSLKEALEEELYGSDCN